LMLMYVGVVELLRNLPLYGGGFVLTVNTRLRYPARRSYRTIDSTTLRSELCSRGNLSLRLAQRTLQACKCCRARSLSKSVTTLRSSAFSKERFAVVCAFSAKLDILKPVHDLTQRTQAWKSFTSPRPKSVLLSATVCAAAVTHMTYGKL